MVMPSPHLQGATVGDFVGLYAEEMEESYPEIAVVHAEYHLVGVYRDEDDFFLPLGQPREGDILRAVCAALSGRIDYRLHASIIDYAVSLFYAHSGGICKVLAWAQETVTRWEASDNHLAPNLEECAAQVAGEHHCVALENLVLYEARRILNERD